MCGGRMTGKAYGAALLQGAELNSCIQTDCIVSLALLDEPTMTGKLLGNAYRCWIWSAVTSAACNCTLFNA